ncbi:MAG TPA: helix-turn-helix transcriptional regulator [Dongiaceae bacterium]|nr:helix-turn-helix transcriptional regulator [Dongiaceae bacterium]
MTEDTNILGLVDHIYAAASDPACWQSTLDLFCAHYPDGHGTILHHDVEAGSGIFAITSSAWDRQWVDQYNAYFAGVNPWLKHLRKRPVGLAVPAEFMLDRASLLKTEFYHDFMRPQNMLSGVGVTIDQDQHRFIAVSALLPERTARDERRNVEVLQRLAPHFRRALQLNRQLARTRLDSDAAEAALDRLALGFVLVDAACKVIFHNQAAGRMLRANDGIRLDRSGTITADASADANTLRKAVSEAARILDADLISSGGAFRVGRPSGKRAYSVMIAPLRPKHAILGATNSVVAILIADNARGHVADPSQLAGILGITKAEARMLGPLIEGCSIKQAGEALGISAATARTHVRNMFAKLGCSRQSDLVRAVMQHPISLLDQD